MSTISAGNTISTAIVVTGDTTGNLVLTAQSNVVNMSTNTGAIIVPNGTTAQRPTGTNGMLRYNTTLACFEVYANNTWALSNVTTPPINTVAPVASGSAVVGQTVSTTTGTWTNSPSTYYYQWRANAVAISSNATSNTFVITTTQLGANLTCNVTAFNNAGNSTPYTTNALGPVVQQYTVTYLVAAGGGGGGFNQAGGGGAGGLKTSSFVTNIGIVYTASVGGGGAGTSNQNATGGAGTASSLAGSGLSTVSCTGGGGGASFFAGGGSGGSGGGGSGGNGAPGNGPGAGTAGQGNNGGPGNTSTTGAGGGGAGAVGGTNAGGAGSASSITGTSVTYAGGGGGGALSGGGGAGGAGGGGAGGSNAGTGASGTANTGGGGGGYTGNGGSGVVILSVPTSSYTGTVTGSPTVTTSGANTILKFTSSGTYTS